MPSRGCGNGSAENTVADLGANSILGVGTSPALRRLLRSESTAPTGSNYSPVPAERPSCTRTAFQHIRTVADPRRFDSQSTTTV